MTIRKSFASATVPWGAIVALLAFSASPRVGDAASVPMAQARAIDVAVEDAADPWSRKDGTGYANDVVRAAYAAVGIEVKLHVMPYSRCKQDVTDGAVVACLSMSADPVHRDAVWFPALPLFTCVAEFITSVANPTRATRPSELSHGTVIGAVLGYEYPESIHALERRGAIVLEYSASEAINLRKLVAGRIDLALVNDNELKSIAYLSAVAGVTGKVRPAFGAGTLRSYIGFSRKRAGAPWALEQYSRGAATIASNGTLAQIRDRWAQQIRQTLSTGRGDGIRPGGAL